MRFLVDENTGPAGARWLQTQGHEVFSLVIFQSCSDACGGERRSSPMTTKPKAVQTAS